MNNLITKSDSDGNKMNASEKENNFSEDIQGNIFNNNSITNRKEKKKVEEKNNKEDGVVAPDETKQESGIQIILDSENIFEWLESSYREPKAIKTKIDEINTKIEAFQAVAKQCKNQIKKMPAIDKRINSLDLEQNTLDSEERSLLELRILEIGTEIVNLKEKREILRARFKRVCKSEKASLNSKFLRAKASSKLYHTKSSYFIKQKMLQILNEIIEKDKTALIEAKKNAESVEDSAEMEFNDIMRKLLEEYDEDLVILCSHHKRDEYFKTLKSTLLQWNPDNGKIEVLGDPGEITNK